MLMQGVSATLTNQNKQLFKELQSSYSKKFGVCGTSANGNNNDKLDILCSEGWRKELSSQISSDLRTELSSVTVLRTR